MTQYEMIAAELRRRIQAGELKPGDRVPSTRALVRDFGVAMATATKALQALQAERLVHPSPGVGTVVGPPPRAARRALRPGRHPDQQTDQQPELNRDEVVRMGIAIADAEGLAALSMRRIASELGVSTSRMVPRTFTSHDAYGFSSTDGSFAILARWKMVSNGARSTASISRTSCLITVSRGCGVRKFPNH